MVECHVCDGGKFSSTASLATLVRDCQKKHPGNNPRNKPLGWSVCQPTLVRGQTNRIMVLRGSFNPPHVGHLNLLTYAFDHSGQNIRAAIIMTSSDKSLNKKFAGTDETIKFSKKERQKLWKSDVRLPQWAWVYEDSSEQLGALRGHLRSKARSEGYNLEYVSVYGPDGIDLFEDKCMEDYDDRYRSSDFNQVLVCDVAREAGLPEQITELRKFFGFSPWKRLELDEQALEEEASAEGEKMLGILMVKAPEEYRRAVARGDHTIKRPVTATMNDSEHVWMSHQIYNPDIQWRFVRANRSAYPEYKKATISSTMLRAAINPNEDGQEKADLQTMALSPSVLLSMSSKWMKRLRPAEEIRKENQQPACLDKVEL